MLRAGGGPVYFYADGNKYAIVSGVIRNDGSPDYWQPIENATHHNLNVDSVSTSASSITIDYTSIGAIKVSSFVVGNDDTLTAAGFLSPGSSVGLTSAVVVLRKTGQVIEDYVSWNGSAFTTASGNMTVGTYSSGVLTLSHASISGLGVSLVGRANSYHPKIAAAGFGATETKIAFYDISTGSIVTTGATGMNAYVSRFEKHQAVDPQAVDTATYPGSNLWFQGVFQIA